MGRAAGTKKYANFQSMFQSSNLPSILFCTPEYLFGTPFLAYNSGTSGQLQLFLSHKDIFFA